MSATLDRLVDHPRMIICCGSGGVGKTTTAAAIALEGARRGHKACVVTIDPAKRLADALGLESLTNRPGRINGDGPGELWALMLDTKTTFDDLVIRYSADADQAQGILENRLYRNISGALSGTQEYMAMEKLYELHAEGGFDLIVVDTPPTRNALDFLDAPKRLTQFIEGKSLRVFMKPTGLAAKVTGRGVSVALGVFKKLVGFDLLADLAEFFN